VCLFARLSVCLLVRLLVYNFMHITLSVHPSGCVSVCASVCVSDMTCVEQLPDVSVVYNQTRCEIAQRMTHESHEKNEQD